MNIPKFRTRVVRIPARVDSWTSHYPPKDGGDPTLGARATAVIGAIMFKCLQGMFYLSDHILKGAPPPQQASAQHAKQFARDETRNKSNDVLF